MPAETTSKTNKVKTKSPDKKSIETIDVVKIRALEEQLTQRDGEITRLSTENQLLIQEKDQRAIELQIINNIGQTLTEGLDLNNTLERVGERLGEALKFENFGIIAFDTHTELVLASYLVRNGERVEPERFLLDKYRLAMRLASRREGKPWVVNTNAEKYWIKFGTVLDDKIAKSFVMFPLLAGRDLVGSITIADYERENAFVDFPVSLIETIASNIGTVIQNVRLFDEAQLLLKETEQRAAELQIINDIGQTLTEGLDLNTMIEHVGDKLREAFNLGNIRIAVVDEKTGLLISPYVYHHGERVAFEEYWQDKSTRYKLLMRVAAKTGTRSWVVNTDAEKSWRKYAIEIDEKDIPKSFVTLPLWAGREVIGGISIPDYEKENAFTDFSIGMLETISSNMGTAVQNARLFDETQRLLKETEQRATELKIINNIGQTLTEDLDLDSTLERVGERMREVLNLDHIGIIVLDPKTGKELSRYFHSNAYAYDYMSFDKFKIRMRLSARGGGRSWVVNTNAEKSWRKFGEDIEAPKSFVALPLIAGKELIGGILFADFEKENAFTDLSINMVETIASNMGTAIQNVRLFDETQRLLKETEQRAAELQIINNIGQTLTEGLDLQSTLERVGERLREALKLKSIGVIANDPRTGLAISYYLYHYGKRIYPEHFSLSRNRFAMRFASRMGGKPLVVNTYVEKIWRKLAADVMMEFGDTPKSFVIVPLLTGKELVGSIIFGDYEMEDAFVNLPINMLETIASNLGTAVQNVRLFEETKKLFAEAEESRASAEQANKAKSTFLANMSHELRTPLNAIIGFTRIVKRKAEGALPEKQIENLDKVLVSSEHLLGLINTVLDIAKIEAGRMDVIPAKFSVYALADQCITLASPLLKPNVNIEKQVDETIGFIFSDQDKIKQIVLNLLSNAAKFTHAGKILLSVEKIDDEVADISVTDSGIGIGEEALGRVFEEFQQADTSTTREYGGTGLGLAISRNLARLLGGDLTATSELGKGSTFTLTVPIQYGKKSASLDTKPESAQSAESQLEVAVPASGKDDRASLKTILIVEDTEFNIDVLAQLLNDDYNLLIAKDGGQGVSMAQENNPDLILMDISLPVMDGFEATRKIRETMKSTPIIGLSAHAMSGDSEKAKEAGCDDYLTKPVDEILLIQKLNQYLR